MSDAIWHLLGTVDVAETSEEQNWFPGQESGNPRVRGRCGRGCQISQTVPTYGVLTVRSPNVALYFPRSILHPPDGLCEPGMSWVLNECFLKLVNGWSQNDPQGTAKSLRSEQWWFSL